MEQIRAFIAIELPSVVRDALTAFSTELAGQVSRDSVRWVKPEAMHLTLRFLGDTAVDLLPQVQRAMDESAAASKPFQLRVEGFGCFPTCSRPRVLWAGVTGEVKAAHALKERLDNELALSGWPLEERAFSPHLTLGRVKDSRVLQGQSWPDDVPVLDIPVTTIYLVQSELRPQGPRYTIRHSSSLHLS
jgi:2'-5' RNA ligase